MLFSMSEGDVHFTYNPRYIESANFIPLSQSLPRIPDPFDDRQTRAFFDNLLQENDMLKSIMDREGISRSDVVGLLYHLGSDCSGAVSCLPMDEPAVKIPGDLSSDYEALEEHQINEIVRRLAEREPLPAGIRDPSPIAGVQSKIALTMLQDGRYALPKMDLKVPTTHILKVPRRGKGHEAHEEAASARLAAECNLYVAIPEVVSFDGIDALLIERFDRKVDDQGRVSRIHQEDFAQALGISSSLKYERYAKSGQGFNVQAIAKILKLTVQPALSLKFFLEATFFNLAIGNSDNHAKNHALLYSNGAVPVMAPLYDLLPVRLNNSYTHELSFNMGKAKKFDEITREDYKAFFLELGMSSKGADNFIKGTLTALVQDIEKASAAIRKKKLKRFDDLIGRELEHLKDVLKLEVDLMERDLFEDKAGGWPFPS